MRPSRDRVNLDIAKTVSERATCFRRKVGCVLVNSKGHILSTGYNGVAAGLQHCEGKHKCKGSDSPSGTDLDKCEAVHAEQNALLQCKDVYEIDVCYTTTQPCIHCIKLLLNTSCRIIVFSEAYHHKDAERLWREAGRSMRNITFRD